MSTGGDACRRYIELALLEHELPRSESAIRLLCMVAGHESGGFRYSRQIRGPALGLLQMEPDTFRDVSAYARRKGLLHRLLPADPLDMVFSFTLAACMGRVFFLRIPRPLPGPDNIQALAKYAKQYWNTPLGKATADDYRKAWDSYFGDG